MNFLAQSSASPLAPALIGAASALVVAVLTAFLGYFRYMREKSAKEEHFLNCLFGELTNVYQHYMFAQYEFPLVRMEQGKESVRLRFSKYGDVHWKEKLDSYGFLDASDIRLLLQLGLRIRNNDIVLDSLLERSDFPVSENDIESFANRASYVASTAEELMNTIIEKRPALSNIKDAIERDLPQIAAAA